MGAQVIDRVDADGRIRCGGCERIYPGRRRFRACCKEGTRRPRPRRYTSGVVLYPVYAADGALRFVSVPK